MVDVASPGLEPLLLHLFFMLVDWCVVGNVGMYIPQFAQTFLQSPANSAALVTAASVAGGGDPNTFQGFIAGFRITNSNTNHRSPVCFLKGTNIADIPDIFFVFFPVVQFLKVRLNQERGIDLDVTEAQLEAAIDLWENGAINFLEPRFERCAYSILIDHGGWFINTLMWFFFFKTGPLALGLRMVVLLLPSSSTSLVITIFLE